MSPKTALAVGLKVDAEAHPRKLRDQLKSGQVNFEDSATTLALLELNAVVGITGFFDDGGSLRSVGIQCAEIDLYAEDLPSGERSLCTTGQFILVAVRDDGHPVPTSRAEALGEGFSNGGNER